MLPDAHVAENSGAAEDSSGRSALLSLPAAVPNWDIEVEHILDGAQL